MEAAQDDHPALVRSRASDCFARRSVQLTRATVGRSQVGNAQAGELFGALLAGFSVEDGTLVFAAQFRSAPDGPHQGKPFSTVLWSKDHGESWRVGSGVKVERRAASVPKSSSAPVSRGAHPTVMTRSTKRRGAHA